MMLSQTIILSRRLKWLNKDLPYNLPIQSLKVNLLVPKKNLKTANITKILAVPCNKNRDNLSVVVTKFNEKLMPRRNVLKYIASIYGPLGLISASHIIGKVIYRKLCNKKLPWDREISQILKKKFKTMCHDITNILTEIPRSILTNKESIT